MHRSGAVCVSVELVIIIIIDLIIDHVISGRVFISQTAISVATAAVVIRVGSVRRVHGPIWLELRLH